MVFMNTKGTKKMGRPKKIIVVEDIEYDVKTILKRRTRKGVNQYLIQWEGFSKEEATWEPKEHINSPSLVEEFDLRWEILQKSKLRRNRHAAIVKRRERQEAWKEVQRMSWERNKGKPALPKRPPKPRKFEGDPYSIARLAASRARREKRRELYRQRALQGYQIHPPPPQRAQVTPGFEMEIPNCPGGNLAPAAAPAPANQNRPGNPAAPVPANQNRPIAPPRMDQEILAAAGRNNPQGQVQARVPPANQNPQPIAQPGNGNDLGPPAIQDARNPLLDDMNVIQEPAPRDPQPSGLRGFMRFFGL